MRELKKKKKLINSLMFILLISSLIIGSSNIKAQPRTIVKGYVYFDGNIIQPAKVNLTFSSQSINAVIFEGGYLIVFTGENVGNVGEFYVVNEEMLYIPHENITILENQYIYNIDLHILSTDGGQPYIEPEEPANLQIIADTGGPYVNYIGISIQFNGTKSTSPDGTITKYEWSFGDKTTAKGATPTHTYKKEGNFTVTFKVTDNHGNSTQNSTYAQITKKPNYPPDKPQLSGLTSGTINLDYNFIIQATDSDNDKIQYNINWSDGTNITTTEYLQNATIVTVAHNWSKPGIFTIKAYAVDDKKASSEKTEQVILIDTIYCQYIGYLTDKTSDGTYDIFYSNSTKIESQVVFNNGLYLIDIDRNGVYDYEFNTTNNELSSYRKAVIKEQGINFLDVFKPYLPFIILFLLIVLLVLVKLILFSNVKQEPKIQKIFYIKNKAETTEKWTNFKQTETGVKHKKYKSIEEEVDEFLAMREKKLKKSVEN